MNGQLPSDQAQRRRIVEELDTTMLVEAAAGTGKTTSMIDRMVALLREGKCRIDTLAAVTFTRKAAAEMRARFQVELERATRQATGLGRQRLADAVSHVERCFIGTIHSFCARLLRERPIEAGVDLAFEELEPEMDAQLQEDAWREYADRLFADGNELIGELAELGLEIAELRAAFGTCALYPDVDEWPAPPVELGDLEPVVAELRKYLKHMASLVPKFPAERGNDKLMAKYELVERRARQVNLDRPADLLDLLGEFGSHGAVLNQWPGGTSQGRTERDRWQTFTDNHALPLVERWQEKRYVVVLKILEQAREVYDRLRASNGGLNYQDLLIQAARLLRDKPSIRRYFRRRFTHLCVDEFQDTDPIQAQVVMYLVADDTSQTDWRNCRPVPGSLFVVGDPKQSIYRFRRADIVTYNQVREIIESAGGTVVPLTANFRTLGTLVEWVNGIFDQVFPATATVYSPAQRAMLVGRQGGSDGDLVGVRTLTVPDECGTADEVVQYESGLIARLIRHALDSGMTVPRTEKELNRGVPAQVQPGDFLIVGRNKWNLAQYARRLQELGIPHQVTGSSALGQVPELTLLAKCLAALVEPDNSVALVAVLRGDLFGFSDQALFAYRQAQGKFHYRASVPAALPREFAPLFEDAFGRLQRYASWLHRLPAVPALERIAADLGLTVQAAASAGGDIQAGTMAKAFEMLRAAQAELHSAADLAEYLQELINKNVEFDGLPVRPHEESAVRIMNLHKVKGLEAPVVFLADATGKSAHDVVLHVDRSGDTTRGYLAIYGPKREGSRQPAPLLARPAGWDNFAATEENFRAAEEQRLLYVAATRAGTRLTIVNRKAGSKKNHWQFFEPYLAKAEELVDPGTVALPLSIKVTIDAAAIADAQQALQQRWRGIEPASYASAAAKEISVAPSRLHHVAGSGEHGTEWGTVIHFLLEAAMRGPKADLARLAQMAVAEQNLEPAAAPVAVEVVREVTRSQIWQRALDSKSRLVEVPFEMCLPAEQGVDGLPTLLRGVIDLTFKEEGGWVIADYKTDLVDEASLDQLVGHYSGQLRTYSQAWERMTGQDVREAGLYFIRLKRYVAVNLDAATT